MIFIPQSTQEICSPPQIQIAMSFLGMCHAIEVGTNSGEAWARPGRDLSIEEQAVRHEALRLLRAYFRAPLTSGGKFRSQRRSDDPPEERRMPVGATA